MTTSTKYWMGRNNWKRYVGIMNTVYTVYGCRGAGRYYNGKGAGRKVGRVSRQVRQDVSGR